MIILSCPACRKRFSVEERLAGKMDGCPACGKPVAVPAEAALPASGEGTRTRSPSPGAGPRRPGEGHRTARFDGGDDLTRPPSSNATQGARKPDAGCGSVLTEFLAPPEGDDELGRLGKYRVLRVLGHGGMGVVFLAEDPKLRRRVAVKAMLPGLAANASAGERFLREAQAMAAVKHDHVATIYQVDEDRGVPFLAMEFLTGESLADRLGREEKLPVPEVVRIAREIAEGLDAAHSTGLIHRDVKPANIWLEAPRGRVKILDFGLARPGSGDAGLTQRGAVVGTPAYMAPEQARGEAVDARSDLFSLGCVLYRMTAGQQPFQGKDIISTLLAVGAHRPAPPRQLNPEIPTGLSDLVMRLLEKEADLRPASAAEVVEALQALGRRLARQQEAGDETVALPATPVRPAAARRRPRLPLVVAALLALGGLIGVGAFTLVRIQGEQGDYVIDTDDPDFSFRVNKGTVILEDRKTSRKYNLKVVSRDGKKGEHELEVADADAGLVFKTKTFTIKRGERAALQAWFERKQPVAAKGAVDDAWQKQVSALPPEKQVEAVVAKLKEVNPGFDGKVTHKVEGSVVTELRFATDEVTDISPVRALTGLRLLDCKGSAWGKSKLSDLSPIRGMRLTTLSCAGIKATDITPLRGMPLVKLDCTDVKITDLSPLSGMKLKELGIGFSLVSDLTPLRGMDLTKLGCDHTQVSDLSPLSGMNLTFLNFIRTRVSSLSPLKGMKLTVLGCDATSVSDLSPLRGMPLTVLYVQGTRVTDLSPLRGMPLKDLRCDFKPERDAEILRSVKTLEKINEKPAREFWKGVDDKKP